MSVSRRSSQTPDQAPATPHGSRVTNVSATDLTALLDNTTDYIWSLDTDCRLIYGNRVFSVAVERAIGYRLMPGDILLDAAVSDARREEWRGFYTRVLAGESFCVDRPSCYTSSMQVREYRFFPLVDDAGVIVGASVRGRDISERKQAERDLADREHQYRVLTETMKDVVWVLDVESGIFRYVSPSVYVQRGFTPEEVMAVPVDHAMAAEDRAAIRALTLERVADFQSGKVPDGHFYVDQLPQPCKDGSLVWTEVVSNYYADPETGRIELRGVTRDITERRQAELALRQARDELEQRVDERTRDLQRVNAELAAAMHVKDEFLSTMSHELRTPLNAILVLAQIMQEGARGPLNERQQRAMQTISDSGEHLLAMINDILDIITVQAGNLTLDYAVHDVDSLCAPLVAHLRGDAARRSQVIDYVCPAVPLLLRVDGRRFDQIVRHLLENAMKFTPDGGRIALLVQPDLARRSLRISVEDNGIGIAQDVIERIFQPFTQADAALSRHYGGSGIGLNLVHHLVDLHGGSITAESAGTPGSGSRFTVHLPWHAPPVGAPGGVVPDFSTPARPYLVLIADDNQNSQCLLGKALRDEGYKVLEAYDGNEAVASARLHAPDLILMDIQMPRCDGLTAIRRLRTLSPVAATPIIAMSSVVVPDDRKRCLDAGADDYLAKPISAQTITRMVRQHIVSR